MQRIHIGPLLLDRLRTSAASKYTTRLLFLFYLFESPRVSVFFCLERGLGRIEPDKYLTIYLQGQRRLECTDFGYVYVSI